MLLALQDEFSADVSIVLFGLWRATQGRLLTSAEFAALDGVVAGWRENVVGPMRALRRAIKLHQDGSPAAAALHESAKRLELDSERILQSYLYASQDVASGIGSFGRGEAATANLIAYGRILDHAFPDTIVDGLARALELMTGA